MMKYINTDEGYIGIETFRAADSFDDVIRIMVSDGYDSSAKAYYALLNLPRKGDPENFIALFRKILNASH